MKRKYPDSLLRPTGRMVAVCLAVNRPRVPDQVVWTGQWSGKQVPMALIYDRSVYVGCLLVGRTLMDRLPLLCAEDGSATTVM